jgi:Putative zinc-finger of transcription factor IIIC complex
VPFVTNIVARSIVPGAPPDLCDEAQRLLGSVRARVFGESAPLPLVLGSSEEPCPACREQIPLRDLNNAVCSRGHAWGERTFLYPNLLASYRHLMALPLPLSRFMLYLRCC